MAVTSNAIQSQESLDQSEDAAIAQKSTALIAPESRKQPPAESHESIRARQLVILSFWIIVIFLGIPIWWWTTSIHRATLPLKEMMNWAEGKVSHPDSVDLSGLLMSFFRLVDQPFPWKSWLKDHAFKKTRYSGSFELRSTPWTIKTSRLSTI